jgi:hypothetical protein
MPTADLKLWVKVIGRDDDSAEIEVHLIRKSELKRLAADARAGDPQSVGLYRMLLWFLGLVKRDGHAPCMLCPSWFRKPSAIVLQVPVPEGEIIDWRNTHYLAAGLCGACASQGDAAIQEQCNTQILAGYPAPQRH